VAIRRILGCLTLLCICSLSYSACGGDDGGGNTLSGPELAAVQAEVVEIMGVLLQSAAELDLASLFTPEGQVIEGVQGSLTVTLLQWVFAQYSPDGLLILDGELNLGLSQPTPMTGELEISGSKQGTAQVNMMIETVADSDTTDENTSTTFNYAGTITYKGVEFEVEDLLEASAPPDSTAAGGNE
jgi:hypothetical protein